MFVEEPVPEEIKQKVLEKISNKKLGEEAFKYIKLVRREDGSLWVKEELPDPNNHALMFTVLACVNYTQRILRGEDIE
ncbi:hypothetical protein [Thermocrinis sp.]